MKNWKIVIVCLLALNFMPVFAQSEGTAATEGLEWYTDINKANEASRANNKPIFAFFTGSDWCGWCRKLQRDVFAKPEFVTWAKNNVILLELDYPRNKQLTPELKQQNAGLQQTFQVQGYPTIWLFYLRGQDPAKYEIEALGSLGYPSGAIQGKEEVKFLEDANAILANKKK